MSGIRLDPNAGAQNPRFYKGEMVHMLEMVGSTRVKGVYQVCKSRYSPSRGYTEYQLLVPLTQSLHKKGAWVRERDLRRDGGNQARDTPRPKPSFELKHNIPRYDATSSRQVSPARPALSVNAKPKSLSPSSVLSVRKPTDSRQNEVSNTGLDKDTAIREFADDGKTSLLVAIEQGDTNLIQELLEREADNEDTTIKRLASDGKTPLHLAVEQRNSGIVRELLKEKPDVDTAAAENGGVSDNAIRLTHDQNRGNARGDNSKRRAQSPPPSEVSNSADTQLVPSAFAEEQESSNGSDQEVSMLRDRRRNSAKRLAKTSFSDALGDSVAVPGSKLQESNATDEMEKVDEVVKEIAHQSNQVNKSNHNYQMQAMQAMQAMLLEQQNKKRTLIARQEQHDMARDSMDTLSLSNDEFYAMLGSDQRSDPQQVQENDGQYGPLLNEGYSPPSPAHTSQSAPYAQEPGASKHTNMRKRPNTGCLTCRRRRIMCGQERPTCGNCIKSKRQCEGYPLGTPLKTTTGILHKPAGSFIGETDTEVSDFDQEIAHLEEQVDGGMMKLVDEKKTLAKITNLRKADKQVFKFEGQQKDIDALKPEHEDIKPRNILVHDDRLIYTDFGYSRDSTNSTRSTTEGPTDNLMPRFPAPEVIEAESETEVDPIRSATPLVTTLFGGREAVQEDANTHGRDMELSQPAHHEASNPLKRKSIMPVQPTSRIVPDKSKYPILEKPKRIGSWGRPKSPGVDRNLDNDPSATGNTGPWYHGARNVIKRTRSRSNIGKSPGLRDLMTQHGGPPIPILSSPHADTEASEPLKEFDHALPERVAIEDKPQKERVLKPATKGILRKPTEKFPEEPEPTREGIAPLKDAKADGVPTDARWTKIDRHLVSPQALEEAKERFEERMDCVIVLRVLSKQEIQRLANRTKEILEFREAEEAEAKAIRRVERILGPASRDQDTQEIESQRSKLSPHFTSQDCLDSPREPAAGEGGEVEANFPPKEAHGWSDDRSFQRYGAMNAQNLLYYQAELANLEKKLMAESSSIPVETVAGDGSEPPLSRLGGRRHEEEEREKHVREASLFEDTGEQRPHHYVDRATEQLNDLTLAPTDTAMDPYEEARVLDTVTGPISDQRTGYAYTNSEPDQERDEGDDADDGEDEREQDFINFNLDPDEEYRRRVHQEAEQIGRTVRDRDYDGPNSDREPRHRGRSSPRNSMEPSREPSVHAPQTFEISWNHVASVQFGQVDSFDGSSNSSSYARSVFSTASLASSATDLSRNSGYSAVQIARATKELIRILQDDENLVPLYKRAINDVLIGPARLERNLRRIFKNYAEHLSELAGDRLEYLASRLVRLKAKFVAQSIMEKYDAERPVHRNRSSWIQDEEQSSDEEAEAQAVDENEFHDLDSFRYFLVSSEAFGMLHTQMRSFVLPKTEEIEKFREECRLTISQLETANMPSKPADPQDDTLRALTQITIVRHSLLFPYHVILHCSQ
jgi:ankyrin repeat protein